MNKTTKKIDLSDVINAKTYAYKTSHKSFKYLKKYIAACHVLTFKEFQAWIEQTALTISQKHEYKYDLHDKRFHGDVKLMEDAIRAKVKGDLFEIFTELFLQFFENDEGNIYGAVRGSCDHKEDDDDLGIDIEYRLAGTKAKAFAQVKYRSSEIARPLTWEVYAKAHAVAEIKYGWNWKNKKMRLVFITNLYVGERDFLKAATKNFGDTVKDMKNVILIGAEYFESLTDGRENFWGAFRNLKAK